MYAEVVVNRPTVRRNTSPLTDIPLPEIENLHDNRNPLAQTFHYHIPPPMLPKIKIGQLVAVPFRTEQLPAIIVGLSKTTPIESTRPLLEILDPMPVVMPAQIELAYWLSAEYLAPLALCLKLCLPPGSHRKPQFVLKPLQSDIPDPKLPAAAQLLLHFLRKSGQIPLAEADPQAVETLLKVGLARRDAVLSTPAIGPKLERTVELNIPHAEVKAVLPTVGGTSQQADLLLYMAYEDDPLPDLATAMTKIGSKTDSAAHSLVEKGLAEIIPAESRLLLAPNLTTAEIEASSSSPAEQRLLRYLHAHPEPVLMETALTEMETDAETVARLVAQKQVIQVDEPPRLRSLVPPEKLLETIIELRSSAPYVRILQLLTAEEGPLWQGWVYTQTGAEYRHLKKLAEEGLIKLAEARQWRDPLADKVFTLDSPPQLTPEQQTVWQKIRSTWPPPKAHAPPPMPVLLHGVTGSGKTEIYLRAVDLARKRGQQAIMLVPEITLATQAVARVSARFPDLTMVWHSQLSPGERFDNWDRARRGHRPIVVGPRSALFAPLPNLGLIIVDEEHESSYKAQQRTPRYHARDAALKLGQLSGALVIMGSASPAVESYYWAKQGAYRLLNLPNRPVAHTQHVRVQAALIKQQRHRSRPLNGQTAGPLTRLPLPHVDLVDLRAELQAGNRSIFSRMLQQAISETLQRGEQVLLFLNRRGTATFVNCRDCGYVQRCPHCDTTMTYHAQGERLLCHYCGHQQAPATQCPDCGSGRIRYFGLGTQRVEETVKRMYPQATTMRWDQDTTQQRGSHDILLHHFLNGQADIMVGTQMIAKGLDLPLVTLVGVISADTALYLPDFRAVERTFQLLMQVAGRAGRSPLGGRVIIQSYKPELEVVQAAARHDYASFYQTELKFRHEQQYPPFKRLATLLYSGPGQERSLKEAQAMVDRLYDHVERMGLPAVEIVGPTPHYVPRLRYYYRWYILLRAADPPAVLRPLMPLPEGWRVDIDPISLL